MRRFTGTPRTLVTLAALFAIVAGCSSSDTTATTTTATTAVETPDFPISPIEWAPCEDDDVDVDVLAEHVQRASELIELCRDRIGKAKLRIEEVVSAVDAE